MVRTYPTKQKIEVTIPTKHAILRAEVIDDDLYSAIDKVVDTVGAGDGFACGVLTGLMEGLPLEKCVERACAIGAIQCTFVGDNEGLPTPEQLKTFMETHARRS